LGTLASHCGSDGTPLLTAAQLHEVYGIHPKTVNVWHARRKITPAGLSESGEQLWDAADVAEVIGAGDRRRHRAA